jgi:hypothetical protein
MASKMRDRIEEEYVDIPLIFFDEFDKAIVGIISGSIGNGYHEQVVYDYNKCVEILMKRDGMDYETAAEHMDFNVAGGYLGEHTPLFIFKP